MYVLGKRHGSKKSTDWSFKEESPAQRFQVFTDCGGHIRLVVGGYSPKIDDQSFCQIWRDIWREKFPGANIAADGHYTWAMRHILNPRFYAPLRTSRDGATREELEEMEEFTQLTREQKADNNALRRVRNRVESPFGWVKSNFKQLQTAWMESKEQQRYMVFLLCGTHNFQLR